MAQNEQVTETTTTPNKAETPQAEPQAKAPAVDYEELGRIVGARQKATEDSVIKGYLRDRNLTPEEAAEAFAAYKKQKEEKKANDKQTAEAAAKELEATKAELLQLKFEKVATAEALKLGVDSKNIDYLLKLADFSTVATDGKDTEEGITKALQKVLDDFPMLKPTVSEDEKGFKGVKVGALGESDNKSAATPNPPKKAWNRFNH